jgi:diaminohydroxyphosphoribosylaminopyrimidine deaminase/5-amino-6-(5-phosphoribosylamino)uracil reductase
VTDAAAQADVDSAYMQRVLALAQRGWGQTAPNPMVGAVVVADGAIVGEGAHPRYGEAHAEPLALHAAASRARGATLYVNLEPCAHHGKTPPCTDAVIAAGVARVVVAVRDPSAIARGGVEQLRAASVRVDIGVEREAALELNAPFFNAHRSDRPWVILKLALSSDGAIADADGRRRWITGSESRLEVHRQRANADGIAIGVGTVLADDPQLTVRGTIAPRVPPRRIIFDSTLRTPLASQLVRTAARIPTSIVAGSESVPSSRRAALVAAGISVLSSSSLEHALQALRREEVRSLYVEGGARLAGSLLTESLVDRVVIFQSPLVRGDGAPRAFAFAPADFERSLVDRRVVAQRMFGEDRMTIYALTEVPCSPD